MKALFISGGRRCGKSMFALFTYAAANGWKVVFARRGHPPYVVDASMVDPVHFTRVLAHYRPDVVDRP